ncbi:hypothetical protein V2E39_16960 [Chryseobacterium arthrosphaerae]|uniref:HTH araC/xylS-type domain-containing protein n=1 Tax=Chryseobacterium arthrosphaerae TaxID=651561 RepID=A0ABU7R2R3_9FLAO
MPTAIQTMSKQLEQLQIYSLFCMAYNKTNYYKRIVKIQEITMEYRFRHKLTYKEIFHDYIEPQFHISIRTYGTYLGIPAKRELKKLQDKEKNTGNQLTFNF